MFRLILYISLTIGLTQYAHAQKTSPEQADRITYNLFIVQQWKELVNVGEKYIHEKVNFFYLEARLGIAYYHIKNYIKATPHLENAFIKEPGNTDLLNYLFYSYKFTNKTIQAKQLLDKNRLILDPVLSNELKNINKSHHIFIYSGQIFSNNKQKYSNIQLSNLGNNFGIIDRVDNAYFFSTGFENNISRNIEATFSYHFISINNFENVKRYNQELINYPYKKLQHELYMNTGIYLGKDLWLIPAIHYARLSYSHYDYQDNLPGNLPVFRKNDKVENQYVIYLGINKSYSIYNNGISFSCSNLNLGKQLQMNLDGYIFPKGNLDIYARYIMTAIYSDSLIFSVNLKAGLRVLPKLWIESFFTMGKLSDFVEDNGYTVYNLSGLVKQRWGVNLIYPKNKFLNLSIYYQYQNRQDSYLTYLDRFNSIKKYYSYQTNTIIGGIKWTF